MNSAFSPVLTIHEAADFLRVSTRNVVFHDQTAGAEFHVCVPIPAVFATRWLLERFIAEQEGAHDEQN